MYRIKVTAALALAALTMICSFATAAAPRAVSIIPKPDSTDVDPATTAIIVKFDQPMGKGMSWTGGGPHYPKINEDEKPGWIDDHTCVLPVILEPAKVYRLGLNSKSFQNFRSAAGEPLPPETITFATAGASADDLARMSAPKAVTFDPPNGATNVSPATAKLSVTFDQPMGDGMSWTGGGDDFPEITGKAEWSQDQLTCTVPVKLQPGHGYKLGINSPSHKNFSNSLGIPVEPVVYEFTTAAD